MAVGSVTPFSPSENALVNALARDCMVDPAQIAALPGEVDFSQGESEAAQFQKASSKYLSHAQAMRPHLIAQHRAQYEELAKRLEERTAPPEAIKVPRKLEARKQTTEKIGRHKIWAAFQNGVKGLAEALTGTIIKVPASAVSMGLSTFSSAVILAVVQRVQAAQAAAAAAGVVPTPGSGPPPGVTGGMNAAAIASYLANGLTLAIALPTTLLSVGKIVGGIKKLAQTNTARKQAGAQLEWVRQQLQVVEQGRFPDNLGEVQSKLSKMGFGVESKDSLEALQKALIAAEFKFSQAHKTAKKGMVGLSVFIGLTGAKTTATTLQAVKSALSIAKETILLTGKVVTASVTKLNAILGVLGPIATGLGVALGGVGLLVSGVGACKSHKQLMECRREIVRLSDKLGSVEPNTTAHQVLVMERARLCNEVHQLRLQRRAQLLDFCSTLAMTLSGVGGLVLAFSALSGPGAIVVAGAATLLMGVSAAITIGAFVMKRRDKRALVRERLRFEPAEYQGVLQAVSSDKDYIQKLDRGTILSMIPDGAKLKTTEEQDSAIKKFRINPEPFLTEHFKNLCEEAA
ncbi:MAG: hypothetical protein KDK78_08955 [Chlamydiia bacterium]|nr:hypothetical protein [Chlamydiia bacterium]